MARKATFVTNQHPISQNRVNEAVENIDEKKFPENVKNVLKKEDLANQILNVAPQRNILAMQNKMELHQNALEEITSQKYELDIKNVQKKVRLDVPENNPKSMLVTQHCWRRNLLMTGLRCWCHQHNDVINITVVSLLFCAI